MYRLICGHPEVKPAKWSAVHDGIRSIKGIFDSIPHDGHTPSAYLESLPIGLKGAQIVVGSEVRG
ncbi:MAG: hypothetical protein ACI92Z_000354 [Paracoccaceae bacterium]|jgi:hypothetical protein